MERKFNDERVNAVRGRAMRKTVWFCWLFTLIYTVSVVRVDRIAYYRQVHMTVVDTCFVLAGVLVQALTLLGGAGLCRTFLRYSYGSSAQAGSHWHA